MGTTIDTSRTFSAADAKGGSPPKADKTAVVFIEFRNEFCSDGGRLHDAVKGVMETNGTLANAADAASRARDSGCTVIHAPISFAEDMSDNPNRALGILKGCAEGGLFVEGTWNAEICDAMKPAEGDLVVKGKKGLDAFPGTDLESLL